ncbi:hypothetical protein Poly59_31870 [Rubripirellula reticaptiva]|uniref:Transposase IS4-like domain-containing protein n=2 Tax=Rubripirellula reticaptiva TaxID=2528013 RepID=A0A5C6ET85_9BACT|nr:hypothetical protein Poly59_31870 [Rubripirellula reticaptiva]
MLFCLASGAVLDIATAPYRGKETGENSLLQTIIDLIFPGEILLADRYYATSRTFTEPIGKVTTL